MCESNSQPFQLIGMEQQEDGQLEEQSEEQRLRSEYNQTLAINRLPFEVMEMILNELPLNDLLACERVCQRWNDYVRNLNIRRMIIAKVLPDVYKSKIRPRKWFFIETNDWWPRNEMLRSDLNIDLSNSFLLNLRQLRVCDPTIKYLSKAPSHLLNDTNFINQLINLEVLEISGIDEGTIDLPNLTCLAIHRLSPGIRIDCPKLTSFRIKERNYNIELPQFLHPQMITHLYAKYYSPAFSAFHSLEYLSLELSDFHEEYHKNDADQFLTAFPKLKVLSQHPERFDVLNKWSLQKLLKRKNALKRNDLKILFFGVQIDDPAQLDRRNEFRLLMGNYEKLHAEELKLVRSISYPQLMASVDHRPEQLPVDIQRTFCNVQRVIVGDRPQDEDALLRLLVGFQKLRIVYFETSSWLSEAFFEKLAVTCPPSSHKCLELHFREKLVSLEFIFKFDNLVCLKLWNEVFKNEFIRRVFDEFGTFELIFYNEPIRITISRRNRCSSFDCSYMRSCLSFDSLDDLLQEYPKRIDAIRRSLVIEFVRSSRYPVNL